MLCVRARSNALMRYDFPPSCACAGVANTCPISVISRVRGRCNSRFRAASSHVNRHLARAREWQPGRWYHPGFDVIPRHLARAREWRRRLPGQRFRALEPSSRACARCNPLKRRNCLMSVIPRFMPHLAHCTSYCFTAFPFAEATWVCITLRSFGT